MHFPHRRWAGTVGWVVGGVNAAAWASSAPGLSLSAQGDGDRGVQPGLVRRHHLHRRPARLSVPGRGHGLGDAPRSVVAAVEHHGYRVLRRGLERRAGPIRPAGDLQYRPGQPVHQLRLHRHAQRRGRRDLHGWPGPLHGQHLHRTSVAVTQIRGGLGQITSRSSQCTEKNLLKFSASCRRQGGDPLRKTEFVRPRSPDAAPP